MVCATEDNAADGYTNYRCQRCGGILEALFEGTRDSAHDSRYPESMWRYRARLPVSDDVTLVSLGEGMTPLHRCESLDAVFPRSVRVWIKDETGNPSGSFKDRLVTVAITRALEVGAQVVTCASSGNAAASTAAYAARAGIAAIVFVPELTPLAKVRQARALGAQVVLVPGDYSNSYKVCDALARRFGWPNLTTTYWNPYGTAGLATVGFELVEQLATAGVEAPELIAVPVGSGPLLYGVHRGWCEATNAGKPAPLLAVQASGCAPIVKAYVAGNKEVEPWTTPTTFASGISDPLRGYPEDGTTTLALVRSSGGSAIAVDDNDIRRAQRQLARSLGVLAEPTGAAALAGLVAHAESTGLRAGSDVVVIVTGHAFKEPDHMPEASVDPLRVDESMVGALTGDPQAADGAAVSSVLDALKNQLSLDRGAA